MERVEIVQYKAFDGTLFNTMHDCEAYERKIFVKAVENFPKFNIVFPMQDQVTDCTAYRINSEDEFNALKMWMDINFSEVWVDDIDYKGHGWYVLQDDHCGWARVEKLTKIVEDWGSTLNKIMQHVKED
jgi:hypothetical protein